MDKDYDTVIQHTLEIMIKKDNDYGSSWQLHSVKYLLEDILQRIQRILIAYKMMIKSFLKRLWITPMTL